jgi:hypothetical protein
MVREWNRMYGKRGLTQYQCVLPDSAGRGAAKRVLEIITQFGGASFLCVIKDCGPEKSHAVPDEGHRTLDIAVRDDTQQPIDTLNRRSSDGRSGHLAKDTFAPRALPGDGEAQIAGVLEARRRWTRRASSQRAIGSTLRRSA